MERFVERHALLKNVNNVSKNVSACFSVELFTFETHVDAHLDTFTYDDAGDTQTLSAHMCLSAFTLGHMSLDLRPSVNCESTLTASNSTAVPAKAKVTVVH